MTKVESEDNSTNDRLTPEAGALENCGTLKDTVVNHLPSQPHSPPTTAAESDFSFRVQSSTDLPSLDQCLTDSVTAEIGMLSSPRHVESADDADVNSVLSTPPLHQDSDNDIALPANECYANGVFPDKIDNLFVLESCNSEQLQFNSLFDDCTKVVSNCSAGDSDVISKQLDKDVNSLLHLGDGDAEKIEDKQQSCEGITCATSDEADHFNCEITILADAVDSLKDVTNVADTCELKNETADSQNVDAAGNRNCEAASPRQPFLLSLPDVSTQRRSESDKESVDSQLYIAECEGESVAPERESELPVADDTEKSLDVLCDIGSIPTKTEYVDPDRLNDDGSKTVASFVTELSSAPACTQESRAHSLLDGNENVDSDAKMEVEWPELPVGVCVKEDSEKDASDDCKLFPSIFISDSTTAVDNSASSTSLWNADSNGALGTFRSKLKDVTPMPCVASFSSSSSDGWSFDEAWLPDWKLQTNVVVKLKKLLLPDDFPASKNTTGRENEGITSKLPMPSSQTSSPSKSALIQPLPSGHTSSPSKLASVQPLLSKMTGAEEFKSPATESTKSLATESTKSPATESTIKTQLGTSERSALSAVKAELSTERLETAKGNKLPLSASVTNPTPSSSSLVAKESSSVTAYTPVERKRTSYTDYCNTPKFQPVVRLVRLPLEFFCMLQQTPRPAASASVSVSDLSKRFVTLATGLY